MKDREKIHQTILSLGSDGKMFTLDDVLEIEGVADVRESDHENLRRNRARSYIRYVYSANSLVLRSVGKNTYKVVDKDSESECRTELAKLTKRYNALGTKIDEHKRMMIDKGYPIQVEMKEMIVEGVKPIAQNKGQHKTGRSSAASAKSKKVVNG